MKEGSLVARAGKPPVRGLIYAAFALVLTGSDAPLPAQTQDIQGLRRQFNFDLAPQRLSDALSQVSQITGMAVLNDSASVDGKESPRVRGRMSVQSALLLLLAGTDLRARLTASGSIVVTRSIKPDIVLDRLEAVNRKSLGPSPVDPAWIAYAELVQKRIRQDVGRDPQLAVGRYTIALKLWFAPDGRVVRTQIARSSGTPGRDERYSALLQGFAAGQSPPEGMRQPVALQFEVR